MTVKKLVSETDKKFNTVDSFYKCCRFYRKRNDLKYNRRKL